mgnify:CR=1 FL=1
MNPDPYIELNSLLKINNIATTGGQAKVLIRSGIVLVNGEIETRNRCKLRVGDIVTVEGKKLIVEQDVVR